LQILLLKNIVFTIKLMRGFAILPVIIFLIIVSGLGISWYTLSARQQTKTEVVSPGNQVDSCNIISNSVFRSVDKHEVGLGPNGPAMGYWSITFQSGNFQWHHSDVVESGTYTCTENILQAKLYNRTVTANYDINRKALIWDGVEYKRGE